MGAGPMTGGRRGLCSGSVPRDPGFVRGFGWGRGPMLGYGSGRGGGRGFGRRFYGYAPAYGYPMEATSELDSLKAEADAMQKSLAAIEKRISELEQMSSTEI